MHRVNLCGNYLYCFYIAERIILEFFELLLTMTNTRESQFNLLDLNEYIIREIFKHLDHLSNKKLRNVCKYLRKCVDGYIKGGDTFILVSEEMPSKIIYAIKGYNNLVSFGL